ncbi:MAG: aldehyde ferredoxin oxidoreductase family protein [Aigarchaeota archaeon]|nr:aldehyde ferredoxin oxidoreductase family protein [Aigarchaeota archaeon]MDW7986373.1 aldehyde ferredoxin oxidoreductase family protein [Nitrososphaerota archaeon]
MSSEKLYGYNGKIIRINLSKKKTVIEEVPRPWLMKYLGGRGLAARYYYEEVGPEIQPFSPENKLFIMTGPLTGAKVWGSSKAHIVTKSPLTNIYTVSNAGGDFGANVKRAGYDGLIIEGRADKPSYISIIDGEVTVRDAESLWGLKVSEAQRAFLEEVGEEKATVACIGPAGEKLSRIASVQVDFPGVRRGGSFGRGGVGAVMGSKNLKGIVAYGSKEVEIADPDKLTEYLRMNISLLKETTGLHTKYGTAQYVDSLYELGAYPLMNFTRTRVEGDLMARLSSRVFREEFVVRDVACFRCPVACGKYAKPRKDDYVNLASKPEYETIWSFGPHCSVFDYDIIVAANHLADDYGLDGISAGYVIGFSMELYEKGIIGKDDLDGLELRFGNGEAVVELTEEIGERKNFGNILAEGVVRAAQAIGRGAEYYAIHVKGMELTAYEPRAFYGMGLAFATSSRGACHNVGGWTIRDELLKPKIDRYAVKGKGILVKTTQDVRGYIDSIGLCTIPRRSLNFTDAPKPDVLKYVIGMELKEDLVTIGERVYCLERLILNREGITRKDDMLPKRLMSEPIPDGPAKGHVLSPEIFNTMLDEYYDARGWTRDGIVSQSIKLALNIP